jgi:hypothetical protein
MFSRDDTGFRRANAAHIDRQTRPASVSSLLIIAPAPTQEMLVPAQLPDGLCPSGAYLRVCQTHSIIGLFYRPAETATRGSRAASDVLAVTRPGMQ